MGGATEGLTPGFIRFTQAWYASANRLPDDAFDEVSIGYYREDGAGPGNFTVTWFTLSSGVVLRLEAFDHSWHSLVSMADLLMYLHDSGCKRIGPDEFCETLVRLGYTDRTPRESPYRDPINEAAEAAFALGRSDRKNPDHGGTNPYRPGTKSHDAWAKGWGSK